NSIKVRIPASHYIDRPCLRHSVAPTGTLPNFKLSGSVGHIILS
ncbi:hypothetical protein JMJ77_0011677, partial [Colletotrichum scovillei]